MRDVTGRLRQQGMRPDKAFVALDIAPADPGPEPDAVAADFNSVQPRHVFQIDEQPGRRHAEGEDGHQTLPARQNHRLVRPLAEQRKSLGETGRAGVVEGGKLHGRTAK